jgi:hypothetical protein
MVSFFSTVKTELGEQFESHGHAKRHVFDYLEVFYNDVSYCPTSLCA